VLQLHPFCQQREIVDFCHKNGIIVEAYSPLVRNKKANDPTLNEIGKRHGESTAQVLIRYCLQKGWVPLPKSDTPSRIVENADVYDFELSKEEMDKLDGLDEGSRGAIVEAVKNT
jgi:diketogulonate reductase-like aldo/keto reductase